VTSSFDLRPDRFVAGTVGPPGQRTFFLQAVHGTQVVSLRLEKQQVAALAEYLAGILADLPAVEERIDDDPALVEPVVAEWIVGSLAVAYEESDDLVLIVAEELVNDDEDDEGTGGVATSPATARFHLTRAQVASFVADAVELVMAGRPSCPLCGHPMNPDGHTCPKTNGHGAP
jgi:uncharacterized repeat protein (TIGR03847 family)